MDIQQRQLGGLYVLEIKKSIDDATSTELEAVFKSLIEMGHSKIVCNLEPVQYISPRGIQVLVTNVKKARNGGGEIKFFAVQGAIRQIFNMTGLSTNISAHTTLLQTVEYFRDTNDTESFTYEKTVLEESYDQTLPVDETIAKLGNIYAKNIPQDTPSNPWEKTVMDKTLPLDSGDPEATVPPIHDVHAENIPLDEATVDCIPPRMDENEETVIDNDATVAIDSPKNNDT